MQILHFPDKDEAGADSEAAPTRRFGNKADNLRLMFQAGLPVPPGFIVPAELAVVVGEHEEQLNEALAKLGTSGPFAVRSSGSSEDGANAAFAGVNNTFLNVQLDQVLEKITLVSKEGCVATEYIVGSGGAVAGGVQQSVCHVVVQQMVANVAVSGVLFTRAPEKSDAMLIEYSSGLGVNVVNGLVTPEQLLVDRQNGSELSAPFAQLVQLAQQIETLQGGCPQDIEFSCDTDDQVFILQSRDITSNSDNVLLSNTLTRETYPNVVTPLTATAFLTVIHSALKRRCKRLGITFGDEDKLYEVRRGRIYQNVQLMGRLVAGEFGVGPEAVIGMFGAEIPTEIYERANLSGAGLRSKVSGFYNIVKTLTGLAKTCAESKRVCQNVLDCNMEAFRASSHISSLPQALTAMRELVERLTDFGVFYWEINAAVQMGTSVVEQLLDDPTLMPGLLVSLKGDEESLTSQQVRKFKRLAQQRDCLPSLQSSWEDVLEFYGHSPLVVEIQNECWYRGVNGLSVSAARWFESPRALIESLKLCGSNSTPPANIADVDYRSHVSFFARPVYDGLIGTLAPGAVARENSKCALESCIGLARVYALAIGRFLFPLSPEDVCFLTLDEIFQCEASHRLNLSDVVARARALHSACVGLQEAPPAFWGRRALWKRFDLDDDAQLMTVQGTPISPGKSSGKLVWIADATQASLVSPGNVVATKSTDSSFTPIFLSAGAVLVEFGGLLSHAAITAREFGIPAVVVPNLQRRLDKLASSVTGAAVDGSTGVVEFACE